MEKDQRLYQVSAEPSTSAAKERLGCTIGPLSAGELIGAVGIRSTFFLAGGTFILLRLVF